MREIWIKWVSVVYFLCAFESNKFTQTSCFFGLTCAKWTWPKKKTKTKTRGRRYGVRFVIRTGVFPKTIVRQYFIYHISILVRQRRQPYNTTRRLTTATVPFFSRADDACTTPCGEGLVSRPPTINDGPEDGVTLSSAREMFFGDNVKMSSVSCHCFGYSLFFFLSSTLFVRRQTFR